MSAGLLRSWWFAVTSLAARLRFRAGRASFVECRVSRSDAELVPLLDAGGRPLGPRLLARLTLATRSPRAGRSGWALYTERLREPGPHRFAGLECAHCRHLYVVQIEASGLSLGAPAADFRSDWFRFAPSAYAGPATLLCPRCETRAEPAVLHLHEP